MGAHARLKVWVTLNTFYAQWRVSSGAVPALRDDQDSPPERLLQAIWQHQRLQREQLQTADGRPLRVLHPGFQSREGGPDFRNAVLQFGEETARSGDIEVDLRPSGWRSHGHDRNSAFRNVILHVIWENEPRGAVTGGPPLLWLRPVLDAPLGELSLWLGGEAARTFPEEWRGQCCAPLRKLPSAELLELLQQAAQVRLRSKAAQFQARARQTGWEQSLWEGLFRALGYKNNVWPMQRLAELRPRWAIKAGLRDEWIDGLVENSAEVVGDNSNNPLIHQSLSPTAPPRSTCLALQARLLGLSGLLPAELTRTQRGSDQYLRQIWDQWWRERDCLADAALPRAVWHLHGLRPANHPQRRLALAAAWSVKADLPAKLERWCAEEMPEKQLAPKLLEILQIEHDDFWSWHWTLKSPHLKKSQPLLGETRLTDLAINVALPWLWTRAAEGNNELMQQRIERRYLAWPPAQDNSVLRLARERLLGGGSPRMLPTAAAQQGLLQMIRDFCDHSNSICDACKLPDLVKEWKSSKQPVAVA